MKLVSLGVMLLAVAAAGCGDDAAGDDDDVGPDAAALPDAGADVDAPANAPDATPPDAAPDVDGFVDPTGSHTQYVANAIEVPENVSEAEALGLDIDGDPEMRPDNALGQILAALSSMGANPQDTIDVMVAEGEILQIFDVQATDIADAVNAGVRAFSAEDADDPDNPADNFSGSEMFLIKAGTPTDSLLYADITGGHLSADGGTVPLSLVIVSGTDPILVNLVGARIEADITTTTMTDGLLGGAITEEEIDTVLIPGIADAVNVIVAGDCVGTTCDPGSPGETLLDLFDADSDGVITADELRDNAFIQSLLAPDVDLFDSMGNFNPRVDGVDDSLSFGVGFTAVGAVFDLP